MNKELGIIHDSNHLRKLILENPDLPIVVLVGEDASCGDYYYTYCSRVSATIDEILDCKTPFRDCYVFSDRDDFREAIESYIADIPEYEKLSDSEYAELVDKEVAKYEPYRKRCIVVTADN